MASRCLFSPATKPTADKSNDFPQRDAALLELAMKSPLIIHKALPDSFIWPRLFSDKGLLN